jgi:hypothetical protein
MSFIVLPKKQTIDIVMSALFNSRAIYITLMTIYDPASLKTVQGFDESSFSLIGLSEGGKVFLPFLFLV